LPTVCPSMYIMRGVEASLPLPPGFIETRFTPWTA